jgi:hypothetical protein
MRGWMKKWKGMSIENHMLCDGLNWKLKVERKRTWMNEFGLVWIWNKKSFLRFLSLFQYLSLRLGLGKPCLSVSLMLEIQRHGNSFTHVIPLFIIFFGPFIFIFVKLRGQSPKIK